MLPLRNPALPVRPHPPSHLSILIRRTGVGANESGAEFGEDNIPGKLDKDYTFPNTTAIQTLRDSGMNIFRVPFLMERLVPDDMTGGVNAAYLKDLRKTIQFITESGAYAVLDPHNYGR